MIHFKFNTDENELPQLTVNVAGVDLFTIYTELDKTDEDPPYHFDIRMYSKLNYGDHSIVGEKYIYPRLMEYYDTDEDKSILIDYLETVIYMSCNSAGVKISWYKFLCDVIATSDDIDAFINSSYENICKMR